MLTFKNKCLFLTMMCSVSLAFSMDHVSGAQTSYINLSNGSDRLAYLDTKPQASENHPTIVFIHGNSGAKELFHKQINSIALQRYRIISIDLPGHGKSFQASTPQDVYTFDGYAKCVLKFIHSLKLTNYILVGWSLGGHIAIEIYPKLQLLKEQNNLRGLVITGTPPLLFIKENLQKAFKIADPEFMKIWGAITMTQEQAQLFARLGNGYDDTPATEFIVQAVLDTDGLARHTLLHSPGDVDELAIVANAYDLPIAVIAGKEDTGINNDYLINEVKFANLWQKKVHVISNVGHSVPLDAAQEFNTLITAFCSDVFNP